ncbi:MAG: thiol-disulfide oxidoreductase DCC family protein [Sulfitobacter sp.]
MQNLPSDLASNQALQSLIVFDGECVLCSGFFRFMLRHDQPPTFKFATAQSSLGQSLYQALGLPKDNFDTNLIIVNGAIQGHLDAFAAAMVKLGWPWRVLGLLHWLPQWIKMPLYRLIARNRYRLFGRYDQCMIPDLETRARFVLGGF